MSFKIYGGEARQRVLRFCGWVENAKFVPKDI